LIVPNGSLAKILFLHTRGFNNQGKIGSIEGARERWRRKKKNSGYMVYWVDLLMDGLDEIFYGSICDS
jgi:hypothetical protein